MLAFFPTPAPDEHFYSIAARYHSRLKPRKARDTLRDLLGGDHHISLTSLPCNLAQLYAQLPTGSLNTPAAIIRHNSMLPIIRPFINVDYGDLLEREMIHTTRCTKLLSRAVYLFDSTPARKLLRFCSACVEEEAKTYGESFWHRSHQYQGVRVCHKHNTWLYATDKYRFKYYCNQLGTPNLDTVWGSRISLRSRNAYALHKVYSKIVHALLASDFGHIDRQSVSILYLSHINKVVEPENLYIENRGKFVSDLRTFFGSEFLEHINCHNSVGTYELWLSYFFSECDRFCHPVYHIIMLMFLGISVDRLAPLARIVEPVTENSSSHSATE